MPVLLWQNSLPKLLWGQTGSLASDKIQTVLARLPLSLASFSWHTGERISDSEYAIGKVREGREKTSHP